MVDYLDDKHLNYRVAPEERNALNEGFREQGRQLRENNPQRFSDFVDVMSGVFRLSRPTILRYFQSNPREFITSGLPNSNLFGSSREDVYKMRVAFAEAFIAGGLPISNFDTKHPVGKDKTKQKQFDNSIYNRGANNVLRQYLQNDYTRAQAIRLNFTIDPENPLGQGLFFMQYTWYPKYSEDEEPSVDFDSWDAAVSDFMVTGWNSSEGRSNVEIDNW